MGELVERITFREFSAWMEYLEWDKIQHSKLDQYLAQIAQMVVRVNVGKADQKKIKLKDFLFDYEKASSAEKSKSAWMGWLGLFRGQLGKKPKKDK